MAESGCPKDLPLADMRFLHRGRPPNVSCTRWAYRAISRGATSAESRTGSDDVEERAPIRRPSSNAAPMRATRLAPRLPTGFPGIHSRRASARRPSETSSRAMSSELRPRRPGSINSVHDLRVRKRSGTASGHPLARPFVHGHIGNAHVLRSHRPRFPRMGPERKHANSRGVDQ